MIVLISGYPSGNHVPYALRDAGNAVETMKKVPDPCRPQRLCVTGSALLPIRPPASDRARWGTRNVRLFPQDPEDDSAASGYSGTAPRDHKRAVKNVLTPNVTDCRSAGVRSGLLRQIHETVEVDDFRRLLDKLVRDVGRGEKERRADALQSRRYIDALHRELTEHMEVLRTLAGAADEASDAAKTTTNA